MAQRKDYGLVGVGANIELGKKGGQFLWNTDHFEVTSDGATPAQLRVPLLPLVGADAASKQYVDDAVLGIDFKESVRVATTVAGTLATSFENGDTIDGIVLATGDRIIIKNQASAVENGIYVVNATGAPTRAADFVNPNVTSNALAYVEEGAVNGTSSWIVTNTGGAVDVGIDPVNWTQFSSAGTITAGVGLTQTGTVFDVNVAATTISVNGGDNLIVDSSANTNQVLLSAGTVGAEATWGAIPLGDPNAVTGILDENKGGTGNNTYTQGDILVATAANVLTPLPIGANGSVLTSDGTDATWVAASVTAGDVVAIEANIAFGGGATQFIGTIPAGGRVLKISVNVTSAWDATETVEIGDAGQVDRLMIAGENDPEVALIYSADVDNLYVGTTVVNATVTSATATAGAAHVIVQYMTA